MLNHEYHAGSSTMGHCQTCGCTRDDGEHMRPITIGAAMEHVEAHTVRVMADWARKAYRQAHSFTHDTDGTVLLQVAGGWHFRIGLTIYNHPRCYGAFRIDMVPCAMCCNRGQYPIGTTCPQCNGNRWIRTTNESREGI